MKNNLVGVDIGSSKVCAAVGQFDKNGQLSILGITSVNCRGIKKAVVIDIDSAAESIKECIEKLERMVDIDIGQAYISLPGGVSQLIHNTGMVAISSEDREIKKNDVERVLQATKLVSVPSDKEIIGIEPKQFIVDDYDNIKDPIGMSGLRLEVEADVIAAKTTVVNNLIKSFNTAGIDVSGICIQPKAVSKVVLTEEEREIGVALINIGAETIDVTIIKNDNICFTSMISIGGNSITNDISLGLKIPFKEAEKIKIKYANLSNDRNEEDEDLIIKPSENNDISIDGNFLREIIEARVEELMGLAKNEIDKSGFQNEVVEIVFTGGGISLIEGVVGVGKKIFKKPVKIGSPKYVGAANPIYAVAVGIVKEASDIFKRNNLSHSINNEKTEDDNIWEKSNKKHYEKNNVLSKVKNFFEDFF